MGDDGIPTEITALRKWVRPGDGPWMCDRCGHRNTRHDSERECIGALVGAIDDLIRSWEAGLVVSRSALTALAEQYEKTADRRAELHDHHEALLYGRLADQLRSFGQLRGEQS